MLDQEPPAERRLAMSYVEDALYSVRREFRQPSGASNLDFVPNILIEIRRVFGFCALGYRAPRKTAQNGGKVNRNPIPSTECGHIDRCHDDRFVWECPG